MPEANLWSHKSHLFMWVCTHCCASEEVGGPVGSVFSPICGSGNWTQAMFCCKCLLSHLTDPWSHIFKKALGLFLKGWAHWNYQDPLKSKYFTFFFLSTFDRKKGYYLWNGLYITERKPSEKDASVTYRIISHCSLLQSDSFRQPRPYSDKVQTIWYIYILYIYKYISHIWL